MRGEEKKMTTAKEKKTCDKKKKKKKKPKKQSHTVFADNSILGVGKEKNVMRRTG